MADGKEKKSKKKAENPTEAAEGKEQPGQQLVIQRIYVADLSFESPQHPLVFRQEWKPEMSLDVGSKSRELNDATYNVVLRLTITVKNEDKAAFVMEVQQGGIFTISGFNKEQLQHTLGSFCPSILYPYAREVVTDVVTRGALPQLILAPINFEALYQQQQAQQEGGEGAAAD